MAMVDSDSDSDVVLHQDIPFNSNHQIMLTFESQLDSTNTYVRHPHRTKSSYQSRDPTSKHHNHGGRARDDDTNDYFELARQARLLSNGNGDALPGTKNEVTDRGKGVVVNTGDSFRLKGSRYQSNNNKPLRNHKGKHSVGDHGGGEGSTVFNGFTGQRKLVLNGCISPDNVSQFRNMSRHNDDSTQQMHSVGVRDKGKGKIGVNECREAQRSGGGVVMNESRETSACSEKQHGSNLRRNYCTGKRKYRKDKPNLGESSSLILGSRTNHSQKITIVNSSDEEERERERDICSEEYWSLEESRLNNEVLLDQSTVINQVESDEMLARRLQDQFNQEAQNIQVLDEEDDDAIIARALQEEDDDAFDVDAHNIMPFRRSRREINDRNQSMEHLYSQSHRFQSRRLPMQIPNHRRTQTRFNNSDMDYEMLLISQLRRGLGSSNMDIDTRLSLLEALEEVFDNQGDIDISGHVYPNDDESYEVLSTLDEHNYQHSGVTDGQINILPISTIKGDKMEDTCVICLEDPAAGDVMRHLPCLHKFHKECIDPWLRKKNACPVCKSSIA